MYKYIITSSLILNSNYLYSSNHNFKTLQIWQWKDKGLTIISNNPVKTLSQIFIYMLFLCMRWLQLLDYDIQPLFPY